MKRLSLLLLCILATVSGFAADLPSLQSLVGREFAVQDDWAGQELAFRMKGDSVCAVWRILGSGRPVLSEIEYPIEVMSPRQCRFEVQLRDESRGEIKIELREDSEIRAYLNGVRIHLEEKKQMQVPEQMAADGRGSS